MTLSFQEEWIDKLLSGTKQQTTRAHTSRISTGNEDVKLGMVCGLSVEFEIVRRDGDN